MLKTLFERELEKRHLSVRAASREMNVTHTTLYRVLRDEPVDLDTVIAICEWMKVRPSTILDAASQDQSVSIPSVIASLIEQDPRLASVFVDMAEDLRRGAISPDDVTDVLSYAAYRLKHANQQDSEEVSG